MSASVTNFALRSLGALRSLTRPGVAEIGYNRPVKSLAVIVFIAAIAGVALFCAQKRTVARGEALGASLIESNPNLKTMHCDDAVPIGKDGATFACKVEFKNGDLVDYKF